MHFDLIIRNGEIFDGSASAPLHADVAIAGERIAAIGDLRQARGAREIDARGLAVCPGFIDIHGHSDVAAIADPRCLSKVAQGVTTELCGQCGASPAPLGGEVGEEVRRAVSFVVGGEMWAWPSFEEYLSAVEQARPAMNTVHLVGHSPLRAMTVGLEDRAPTPDELRQMVRVVEESLEAGAAGLSSGLIYPPSMFAQPSELVELARACARRGKIYCTHIRSEAGLLLEAVHEAIAVARATGVRVEIAHHKAAGRSNWGRVRETVRAMEAAEGEGLAVAFDVYPYTAGSTSLMSLLPPFAREGGPQRALERLADESWRERIRREIERGCPSWPGSLSIPELGFDRVLIAQVEGEDELGATGKTLEQVAQELGLSPIDALFELLLRHQGGVAQITFSMCEEDVEFLLAHRLSAICSDAAARAPDGPLSSGKPHPRAYGAFVRVLGRYVRERKVLELPQAIAKMTGEPARRIGLAQRGLLREGYFADLALFRPETVADQATYEEPHQLPRGMEYVIVNGQVVFEQGRYTGARPGRVLRV